LSTTDPTSDPAPAQETQSAPQEPAPTDTLLSVLASCHSLLSRLIQTGLSDFHEEATAVLTDVRGVLDSHNPPAASA